MCLALAALSIATSELVLKFSDNILLQQESLDCPKTS